MDPQKKQTAEAHGLTKGLKYKAVSYKCRALTMLDARLWFAVTKLETWCLILGCICGSQTNNFACTKGYLAVCGDIFSFTVGAQIVLWVDAIDVTEHTTIHRKGTTTTPKP